MKRGPEIQLSSGVSRETVIRTKKEIKLLGFFFRAGGNEGTGCDGIAPNIYKRGEERRGERVAPWWSVPSFRLVSVNPNANPVQIRAKQTTNRCVRQ